MFGPIRCFTCVALLLCSASCVGNDKSRDEVATLEGAQEYSVYKSPKCFGYANFLKPNKVKQVQVDALAAGYEELEIIDYPRISEDPAEFALAALLHACIMYDIGEYDSQQLYEISKLNSAASISMMPEHHQAQLIDLVANTIANTVNPGKTANEIEAVKNELKLLVEQEKDKSASQSTQVTNSQINSLVLSLTSISSLDWTRVSPNNLSPNNLETQYSTIIQQMDSVKSLIEGLPNVNTSVSVVPGIGSGNSSERLTESPSSNFETIKVYFETGSADLAREQVRALLQFLADNCCDREYTIFGHADQTGFFTSNYMLSSARASTVASLIANSGAVVAGTHAIGQTQKFGNELSDNRSVQIIATKN